MTMTLVSTVTVGAGGAATIEWTGIPQTGTDLLIVLSARSDFGQALWLNLNSSSVNFTGKRLTGNGSTVTSATETVQIGYVGYPSHTASTFGNTSIYIPNYAGSTNKSILTDSVAENNATAANRTITATLWSNTSAITSVQLVPQSGGVFVQYSTASLYAITKGSGGATVS